MEVTHSAFDRLPAPIDTPWLRIPESRARRFSITIIGDIRVEARSEMRQARFGGLSRDTFVFSPVTLTISGTALNMAKEAVAVFTRTEVIARIGNDEFTPTIREHLTKLDAVAHLTVDEGMRNSGIIIIRDGSAEHPGGVRLLISGEPAPSHRLSTGDIDEFAEPIRANDLLFVDGYSILRPESASAVRKAMLMARESGRQVCIDLVPHNIDEFLKAEEIQGYVALANYVIVEAGTLAKVLGLPHEYPLAVGDIGRILPVMDTRFPGNACWLLRYGKGNMDEVVMYKKDVKYVHYHTGYMSAPSAARAGYGDKVAAHELAYLLRNENLVMSQPET